MRTILRTLLLSGTAAIAAVAASQTAPIQIYYALDIAPTVMLTTLPITATTTGLSVYYKSTVTFTDSEIFLAYDRSTAGGATATPGAPIDGKVSLTNPVGVTGSTVISTTRVIGGAGTGTRPYGLDLVGVAAPSGTMPVSVTGNKLFSVSLNNLSLASGQSYTIGFNTASAAQFTTNFFDASGSTISYSATPLTVTAAAVPEPATVAALGFGALAMLRRRKRA